MLSSAKIGRSSWRYYQRTVAGGACEYYAEHGDTPGRWHGSGLTQLVTNRFRELSDAAGLRPVRLHDLRHGQASPESPW